jgi:hypothetical protein
VLKADGWVLFSLSTYLPNLVHKIESVSSFLTLWSFYEGSMVEGGTRIVKIRKFKSGRTLIVGFLVALFFAFFPNMVAAIPSARMLYVETPIDSVTWEYNYTVWNDSDPVADAGVDLIQVSLRFSEAVTLTVSRLPDGWGFENSPGYILTFSENAGAPLAGSDIPPGAFLSGFVFDFDMRVGNLPFEAGLLVPPDFDREGPFHYSGNTAPITDTVPVPAPVPEPSTIILMTAGMGALGLVGRKRIRKPRA